MARRRFGWIHKRKLASGTWYYVQWTEPSADGGPGRRVTRSAGRSLRKAKKLLAEMESKVLLGTYAPPPTVAETRRPDPEPVPVEVETFVAYATRILKDRLKPELKPKTLELYEGNLAALSAYFGARDVTAADGTKNTVAAKRLDEITGASFLDFRAWRRTNCRWKYGATIKTKDEKGEVVSEAPRPLADSTINRDHHFAGLIFGHAVADGLLADNPLARIRVAGGRSKGVAKYREREGRRIVLSKGEIATLILKCDTQFRSLVLAALFTGCRKGELLALRWSDINFDRKKVSIYRTKDESADDLDLHPVLAEELDRLKKSRDGVKPGDLVFLNRWGKPWQDVRKAWGRALAGAKLAGRKGLVFHSLRHSFASHFLEGGGAITDLQAQLGHSKVATTQRYARMIDERRRSTVFALNFGTKPKRQTRKAETKPERAASGS